MRVLILIVLPFTLFLLPLMQERRRSACCCSGTAPTGIPRTRTNISFGQKILKATLEKHRPDRSDARQRRRSVEGRPGTARQGRWRRALRLRRGEVAQRDPETSRGVSARSPNARPACASCTGAWARRTPRTSSRSSTSSAAATAAPTASTRSSTADVMLAGKDGIRSVGPERIQGADEFYYSLKFPKTA